VPAINPDRLKKQIEQLGNTYENPEVFVSQIKTLFEFYENHIVRTGQSGKPDPLIQAYHIPKPVIRLIIQETSLNITQNPDIALEICDLLWKIPYLETQQLAAIILGRIPVPPSEKVLEKLNQWLQKDTDPQVINFIIEEGLTNLFENDLPTIFVIIEDWLNSNDPFYIRIGLESTLLIIKNKNFNNLPIIFRLLDPLICNIPNEVSPELISVLEELIKISPNETSFFLQRNLRLPDCNDISWIIRRLRKKFPLEIQKKLREVLSERKN